MNSIGINPSTEAPQFLNQWAHFKLQKRHSTPLVHACIVETNLLLLFCDAVQTWNSLPYSVIYLKDSVQLLLYLYCIVPYYWVHTQISTTLLLFIQPLSFGIKHYIPKKILKIKTTACLPHKEDENQQPKDAPQNVHDESTRDHCKQMELQFIYSRSTS